ncbi:hypothetical protein HO133_006878 [Letharia lupina]|uniref:Uncharacterized protein n=1 Tax=Letharia lupina TaxID=560253 RepID=A0A8H6C5L9_9LECA|nr:uncharacterized protein HO133_006878 [Letharia lupina]KAF6217540.1 hypothetical protein HO133_006878 [Letharia lupina]
MFSKSVLVFMFPLALTFASPLQDAGDQTIQLSSVDFRSPANLSDDETAIRLNVSNEIRIQCDGEKYGFNPDVVDCQNARSYYKRSSTPFTYGERHSGHGINVFPLPYRLMGDEALCYLEPVLIDSSLGTGVASINQLSNAAYELILQCAVRQSKGGIATGIGGQNMAVVLGTYHPDVQCRGTFGPWASCRSILGDMPTLAATEIFGPPEDLAVQVPLPQFLESSDGKCMMRIFGRGGRDITSWFKVWEAATAVYAVCVRHQKVGSFRGLGELGNIFFTMTAQTPKLGNLSTTPMSTDDALSEV